MEIMIHEAKNTKGNFYSIEYNEPPINGPVVTPVNIPVVQKPIQLLLSSSLSQYADDR